MLTNEIPMDSLMALAEERRRRYTGEAERFRLGRLLARARRTRRRDPRRAGESSTADAGPSGTRVTADGHDLCAWVPGPWHRRAGSWTGRETGPEPSVARATMSPCRDRGRVSAWSGGCPSGPR